MRLFIGLKKFNFLFNLIQGPCIEHVRFFWKNHQKPSVLVVKEKITNN